MLERQKLLIVAPFLGASSEVWMWRQIVRIKLFNVSVLTWQHNNQDMFPMSNILVENMRLDFNKKDSILENFLKKLGGLLDLNFCRHTLLEKQMLINDIKKIQPDVLLCHFGYTALRILPIVRALKLPMVVHFHGLDLSSALRNKWYRWSLKSSLKHFSSIVVVGQHQFDWMTQQGVNKDKLFLLPCGVPTQEFFSKCKTDNIIEETKFIAVSRLTEKKGLEYTLRAFKEVISNQSKSRLTIVGDGPLRKQLEELVISLSLQNHVEFIGTASPSTVQDLLGKSDVFVQHSIVASSGDMEGSPVSIAEACASGLPVVTTRGCGGTEDLIMHERSGFLVEQRDIGGMAEAMKRLANNSALQLMMGEAGRKHMIQHFDTDKQVEKLERILVKAANR